MSMHARIAQRIAGNLRAIKKASGVEAASLWWETRFKHVTKEDFAQVRETLKKMPT
jgi:hypothetical protein